MRKLLFSLFSIISLNFCFAQELELPFPNVNASWSIIESIWGTDPALYYSRKFVAGDSLINDTNYRILYRGKFDPSDNSFNTIEGFYRVENTKVFYRETNTTAEMLLYDFSIQVGDTFLFNFPNFGISGNPVLISKDSILINNFFYKKFNFSYTESWAQSAYWIEGYGSDTGFFPFLNFFEGGYEVSCFKENEIGFRIDNNFNVYSCFNAGILESDNINLKISPNPTSDFILLEGDLDKLDFVLHDFLGKYISKGKTNSKIDLCHLETGIYFLSILKDGEIVQKEKIVKL